MNDRAGLRSGQVALLAMSLLASAHAAESTSHALQLAWRELAPLPDPAGLKGMYAGVSDGHAIFAGGSNFPVPQRTGGKKTFHHAVYVRTLPFSEPAPWRSIVGGLPRGLGEGAAVTIGEGVACLGGHDGTQPIADAFVLRWDRAAGAIVSRPLPSLPAACANGAAVFAHGRVYVAGGESAAGPLGTLWRLDPAAKRMAGAAARWEMLPSPPGRPRSGGILIAVTTPAGERLLYGGGVSGPAKSQDDYLRDMWLFDPAKETWTPAASLPRGAVLAAALRVEPTRVLVLGGSDGHDFPRMKELGDRYRIPSDVLHYDAATDRWSRAGTMPLGVVGAAVVQEGEGWVIAGGEYSPGLRTPGVHALRVRAR